MADASDKTGGSAPRLALVSGVGPGSGCVGEIILRDLCRVYPRGRIVCAAVTGAKFKPQPAPDLAWVTMMNLARRFERPRRSLPGRLSALSAMIDSGWHLRRHVAELVEAIVAFSREQRAEKVWMVLDAVTLIAMGPDVAKQLDLPLVSLVWDAPEYLLRQAGVDRSSRSRLLRRFGDTLGASERVAVVSDAMAEAYTQRYGAECVILRHGLDGAQCHAPADHPIDDETLTIGFAGGMYAASSWVALTGALDAAGWRVGGRNVRIRALGGQLTLKARAAQHVEFLGWRSTDEAIDILSRCDVNYLPHPFETGLEDLATYSFPTKLSTYVAAGRPVFVHAPHWSSLSQFFKHYEIGIICQSLDPSDVLAQLERLMGSDELYSTAARCSAAVARDVLSMDAFHRGFAEFLGIDHSSLEYPSEWIEGVGIRDANAGRMVSEQHVAQTLNSDA